MFVCLVHVLFFCTAQDVFVRCVSGSLIQNRFFVLGKADRLYQFLTYTKVCRWRDNRKRQDLSELERPLSLSGVQFA